MDKPAYKFYYLSQEPDSVVFNEGTTMGTVEIVDEIEMTKIYVDVDLEFLKTEKVLDGWEYEFIEQFKDITTALPKQSGRRVEYILRINGKSKYVVVREE